jgi:hypothetical protein
VKILAVEGDPVARLMLEASIRGLGHEVIFEAIAFGLKASAKANHDSSCASVRKTAVVTNTNPRMGRPVKSIGLHHG